MNFESFKKIINDAWENKNQINQQSNKEIINAISETIELLDNGKIRVAEKKNEEFAACLGALHVIKEGWETEAIPESINKNNQKLGFFAKIFGIKL